MPGLSTDPDKAKRQLAGLEAGRRVLAHKTLGMDHEPATPQSKPPAPTEPGAGGDGLGVPVHTYGAPPQPPREEAEPAAVPVAEDPNATDVDTHAPRRGPIRNFIEGFRGD